jgi:hypothetical protein
MWSEFFNESDWCLRHYSETSMPPYVCTSHSTEPYGRPMVVFDVPPRTIIVVAVEGTSDRLAIDALARRRQADLDAAGIMQLGHLR